MRSAAAPAAMAKSALADASARSAAEWIERIHAFVREGKLVEAAQEVLLSGAVIAQGPNGVARHQFLHDRGEAE